MEESGKQRMGSRVRIILINDFHYSGIILSEDKIFLTIKDKFNAEVTLRKADIQILEVSNG